MTSRSILIWSLAISALVTAANVLGLVDQGVYDEETKNASGTDPAEGRDLVSHPREGASSPTPTALARFPPPGRGRWWW